MTEKNNETTCDNLSIERLFKDAKDDECKAIEKKYKVEIRGLLNQRRQAAKLVANLDRELEDLKLKITHEIEGL